MVMSRWVPYGVLSTTLAVSVVVHAFQERPNFYAACVYLSQSSACSIVLANMFFVTTLMFGKLLQHLCFGRLRAIEVEHLYERSWYAVTESCLAMTIFREEFDSRFLLYFTTLIFVKIFHWLAHDRVDFMEQTTEGVSRKFHVRMCTIIGSLLAVDFFMAKSALDDIFRYGPNAMILFAFEFTILGSIILSVAGKYMLNLIESRMHEQWDNKQTYVFYLDLLADFFKLVTYIAFFATVFTFYGLPLHIVRDLYVTLRSFTTKCRNFLRFRQATRDMDTRYPDATPAELEALGDPTCIVCRDDMLHASQPSEEGEPARSPLDKPKKLPCNHILHFRCLRSWLERQQSCPLCRRPVLEEPAAPAAAAPAGAAAAGQNRANQHLPGPPRPAGAAPIAAPPGLGNLPVVPNTQTAAPAPGPAVQYPRGFGGNAVPLPAGFQLPPGWALLPVTTDANPVQAAAAERRAHASTATSQGSSTTSAPSDFRMPDGTRAPPIIPLFGAGLGLAEGLAATATIPTLTDEQITAMEGSTRRTVEERIRVLSQVQARVTEGLLMLTRLASVSVPAATPTQASQPETAAERPLTPTRTTTNFESAVLPDERLRPVFTSETATERAQSPRRSPRRRRASQDSNGSASSGGSGERLERRSTRLASRQVEL